MEKASFVYGMVTAFCECVAAGCKPLALSPPLQGPDYAAVQAEAYRLVAAHGLQAYHEQNEDLPPDRRAHWIVIYAQPQTLVDYLAARVRPESDDGPGCLCRCARLWREQDSHRLRRLPRAVP